MEKIYCSVADGCIKLQEKLRNYVADRLGVYKEKEEEIRDVLAQMPSADKIEELLKLVGMDMKSFTEMCLKRCNRYGCTALVHFIRFFSGNSVLCDKTMLNAPIF